MASIWDALFPKQDYRTAAPSGGYADLYANSLLGDRTDTPTSVGAMETGKDFIPGIGDAIALKEAYDAASRGDKVAAGLLTAGAALGLIPGAGDAVARPVMAAGRKAADVASRIEVDPNAVGSLLGNVRVKPKALTKDDAPLIAHHNLDTKGVMAAAEIGGIPMPSLAISNANFPLEEYGDISLLLAPNKVAPSRDLPVWPNDAYTGRQNKGFIDFVDEDSTRAALRGDPDFGHMGSSWMDSTNGFDDQDYMMRVAQFGRANKIANPKDFEQFRDYVNEVQARSGEALYDTEKALAPYGGMSDYGDVQRMIYPEEPYTPSGQRVKPKPYTIEEAYKRMNKAKSFEAGSENTSSGGVMRAISSDKFKSLDEIKSNRGLLQPLNNDMADVKGSFDSDVYYAIEDLAQKHFDGRHTLTQDFITDLARGKDIGYADAPPEAISAAKKVLSDFKKQVKGMPTEYFEAKPRSVAQLRDFDAALVPQGNTAAIDKLKRQGVPEIIEYNDEIPGMTRADKIRQMQKLLFGVGAAPTGLLALREEQKRANEEQYKRGLLQ
jgi:hypothetical protein